MNEKATYEDVDELFSEVYADGKKKMTGTKVKMTRGGMSTFHLNVREWYMAKGEFKPKRNGMFIPWDVDSICILRKLVGEAEKACVYSAPEPEDCVAIQVEVPKVRVGGKMTIPDRSDA